MNILLINHYAGYPEIGMEFRPFYLAKEWIKNGHQVTILSASFSHLRKKQPKINNNISKENIESIEYIWFKTPEYQGNGIGRIKNMLTFVKLLRNNAKKIAEEQNPDVVIASSTYPMDVWAAKKIAKIAKAKLIFEIHDLWPLSPMELGGFSKFHPFIMMVQYFENYAYKHADSVISILPKTKKHCQKHGLKSEKWHHIPNGIVIDDWDNVEEIPKRHKEELQKIQNSNKKIIGYAGGHAISNSLDTFIEAAKLMQNDNKYFFVLVGNGVEKNNLISQAAELENVLFLDSINKLAVPDLLKYFDYLFIGWNKSPLYKFGISPNKIFDYFMAQKPIIHAVEAGNDILKDANAGLTIAPKNPEAIVKAIIDLSNLSNDEIIKLGENGKKYVLENHDYRILSKNFIEVLQK